MEKHENWDDCMLLDFSSKRKCLSIALIRSNVKAESQLIAKLVKQRSDVKTSSVLQTALPMLLH